MLFVKAFLWIFSLDKARIGDTDMMSPCPLGVQGLTVAHDTSDPLEPAVTIDDAAPAQVQGRGLATAAPQSGVARARPATSTNAASQGSRCFHSNIICRPGIAGYRRGNIIVSIVVSFFPFAVVDYPEALAVPTRDITVSRSPGVVWELTD